MAEGGCPCAKPSAVKYLKKHKILEMVENITACLVFERPENPKQFIISYIRNLMDSRGLEGNYPCLFDSTDIKCLFGMLDASNSGFITFQQFKSVFKAVGGETFSGLSPELVTDEINFYIFLSEMKDGLNRASATFAPPPIE